MRRFLIAILCLTASGYPEARAQTAFEVASFKLTASGPTEVPPNQIAFGPRMRPVTLTGNRVTAETSLEALLQFAFDLPYYDLKGPGWLRERRYQLAALAPERITTRSQVAPMLKQLLIERLHLRTHWEDRVQSVQTLVVAQTGHKLTEAAAPDERKKLEATVGGNNLRVSNFRAPGQLFANAIGMDALARMISVDLGEPVINQTGLDKEYSIDARWTPAPRDGVVPGSKGSDAEFPRALLKQLGLRLEKRRLARKVLVVDHADLKPVEN